MRLPKTRMRSRIVAASAVLAGCGLGVCPPAHSAGPHHFTYQVPFPAPPANGDQALATLDARAQAVLTAVACGVGRIVRAAELCRFYATDAECDTWEEAEAFRWVPFAAEACPALAVAEGNACSS